MFYSNLLCCILSLMTKNRIKKVWQQELAESIRSPELLAEILRLPPERRAAVCDAHKSFPVRVPRAWIGRMEKGDSKDPLIRQVLPDADELLDVEGFSDDPLSEGGSMPYRGILHKYHGRALLIASPSCAIHCRYCFRRHFPYQEAMPAAHHWHEVFHYLENSTDISEVILSGGDPLTLANEKLFQIMRRLVKIPHIRRLRLHTRIPIVLPSRIDQEFIDYLGQLQQEVKVVTVLHVNHEDELTVPVRDTIFQMRGTGTILLNQAVLLQGVNDSVDALAGLGEALFDAGVLPYYLHLLDRVRGASHFEVSKERAVELMVSLNKKLPGYLVPKLVQERAGEPCKTVIDLNQEHSFDEGL